VNFCSCSAQSVCVVSRIVGEVYWAHYIAQVCPLPLSSHLEYEYVPADFFEWSYDDVIAVNT